jgi:L-seryl-tRNA(Ser) seleniumtransferase
MQRRPEHETGESAAELRRLPSVARLLAGPSFEPVLADFGSALVTDLVRERLGRLRERVRQGELAGEALSEAVAEPAVAEAVAADAAELLSPRPRPLINATGVVVHTNLGRSLLSPAAARQVAEAARGYLDLEYDLATGARGNRLANLEPLARRLFPGQAFTVVNNNAAATLITLRALSRGRRALISRGELVEIGGSFRMPDVFEASGALLGEVGTTNRTRLADYESAVTPETGLILKVHTSNFRVVGFAEETSIDELAELARRKQLPLVVDWGSGNLLDLGPLGIRDEIPVRTILEQGADLVTFSGDKLLGGPQAGFIVGREDLVQRIRRDPLSRVCRLDRLRIGALHQTLAAYARGKALEDLPTLRMLAMSAEEVGRRADRLRDDVVRRYPDAGERMGIEEGISRTGGGSSPTGERPTRLLAVTGPTGDAAALERRLREGRPPVIGRIREGRLLLDLRTVLPEQEAVLADRLCEALGQEKAAG